ncbi:MAG: hypothetical protein J2O48_07440, partial [Solirubrobacterales bacterium]|nr:hypothetical protein [Solirubrobacterales bacterium]
MQTTPPAAAEKPLRCSCSPQFRDFLSWLRTRDQEASRAAWAQALEGVTEPTVLAGQPKAEPGADGSVALTLEKTRTDDLAARAGELGITLNTLVQAAWAVLLARLTGRDDVVFGATVSGRPGEVPGVEAMVG